MRVFEMAASRNLGLCQKYDLMSPNIAADPYLSLTKFDILRAMHRI